MTQSLVSLIGLEGIQRKIRNFVPDTKLRESFTRIHEAGFPSWQYNGVAPLNDILLWCEEKFGDDYVWSFETIYFKHESDRTMFVLRWS